LPGLVYALGGPYQRAVRQLLIYGVNRPHQSSRFPPVGLVEQVALHPSFRHKLAENQGGLEHRIGGNAHKKRGGRVLYKMPVQIELSFLVIGGREGNAAGTVTIKIGCRRFVDRSGL
jgi:hypothetical protein